jgi:signal transduction histidine kinase
MDTISDLTVAPTPSRWITTFERLVAAVRNALPTGIALPQASWDRRHRFIVALGWGNAVAIPIVARMTSHSLVHGLVEGVIVSLPLLVAGMVRASRSVRAAASSISLLTASAIFVHLSGGLTEMHFHYFVMLGVVSLYQSWMPFGVAIAYVLLQHGVLGAADPRSVFDHAAAFEHPWRWAGVHALFVAGSCAVSVAAWKLNEVAQAAAEDAHRELLEGQHAVVWQLEAAERMKTELLAIVSHELRTPLTAIIGYNHILIARGEQIEEHERTEWYQRIDHQSQRLKIIVENLLSAVSEPDADGSGVAMGPIIQFVVSEFSQVAGERAIDIDTNLFPGGIVQMGPEALRLCVVNVLGNAITHALPATVVSIESDVDEQRGIATICVENEGEVLSEEARSLVFERFYQLDSSTTRAHGGLGIGLFVVRRLVLAVGGDVQVLPGDGGRVRFELTLPLADVTHQRPAEQAAFVEASN